MKENLLFLFVSGIILGSGPCVSFCAPILMSYTAVYKASLKRAVFSYLVFSACKVLGYMILGALCAIFVGILNSDKFSALLDVIYILMALFILFIGISTLFLKQPLTKKYCAFLHRGNIRNVGILGFLVGLSPCLPLFGILNYIVIISKSGLDAIYYSLIFGLGTVISPLLLLVALSGGLADWISGNKKFQTIIRVGSGAVLIFLVGRIILQILLR